MSDYTDNDGNPIDRPRFSADDPERPKFIRDATLDDDDRGLEVAGWWPEGDASRYADEIAAMLNTASIPGASTLIDLSNLKDRLLAPRKLARDENGMLCHPELPVLDESVSMKDFLAVFGVECRAVAMESDSPDLHDLAYEDISVTKGWNPAPPPGDNWVLTDIYDTEDGPHALFLRDFAHSKSPEWEDDPR